MTDPNGWPDPSWPGVPLNPERDGFHLWSSPHAEAPSAAEWSRYGYWRPGLTPESLAHFTYHGPLHTPAEVAALVAEARAKALEEATALTNDAQTVSARVRKFLNDLDDQLQWGPYDNDTFEALEAERKSLLEALSKGAPNA